MGIEIYIMLKATLTQITVLIFVLVSLNEARRITRNELARMLGQNGGYGFKHGQSGYKPNKASPKAKEYDDVNTAAQKMAKEKGIDVKPAKGQMFSSLTDVAKYLKTLGLKIDAPSDSNMAGILNSYGVLNDKEEANSYNGNLPLQEKSNLNKDNPLNAIDELGNGAKGIGGFPRFHQERMMIQPNAELQIAQG